MATVPSPPILIWTPGGGVPVGPISNPPVYSQKGVTKLVAGQAYIDVVFGSTQTTSDWVLATCDVENTTDISPLNIWPGIITNRTAAGFRLQLNGMPDSGNYYLHWAVSGVNITPTPASTYFLSGPASGIVGLPSTFTVNLPASTTGMTIVTPSDSGGGGTFSPTSVTLTTGVPSTTFTYTPGSSGTKTISVTNIGGLVNPVSVTLTVVPVATGYSLSGPSGGTVSVASTPFTVTLTPGGGAVIGTVTVTPSDAGDGGVFTPATVGLTTGAPSTTFTYTPASVGSKTISTTNNGGLTDPGSLPYTSSAAAPTFIDNFTGATGPITGHTSDTGHTWGVLFSGTSLTGINIQSGKLFFGPSATTPDLISNYQPAANCEATITIVKGAITGTPEVGMWLRAMTGSVGTERGYMGRFVEGTGYQFYRLDTGTTYTQLGSNVAGTMATGDTLRFTVSGTGATVTFTLYKNGSSVASTTDTAGARIVTSGYVGIHLYDPSVGVGDYEVDQITSP